MDNYFNPNNNFSECPPMMEDGRLFTDFRSAQVREKYFEHKNCLGSQNEGRTFRINNGEAIMDGEWDNIVNTNGCQQRNIKRDNKQPKKDLYANKDYLLVYEGFPPEFLYTPPCCDNPKTQYFHMAPKSQTSNAFNKGELLAYNGLIRPPTYGPDCYDDRLTVTVGSVKGRENCDVSGGTYGCRHGERCPKKCCGNNAPLPDNVRSNGN